MHKNFHIYLKEEREELANELRNYKNLLKKGEKMSEREKAWIQQLNERIPEDIRAKIHRPKHGVKRLAVLWMCTYYPTSRKADT